MRRPDVVVGAALAVAALAVRLPLLHAAPYGDEAAHYAMARNLGFLDRTVHYPGLRDPLQLYPLTLGRPLFALLYAPASWFGFTAFRLLGMLVSCTVAVLVYALARRLGGGRCLAGLAGAVAALHPVLVVWGSRVFPDAAMTAFVLAALLAHDRGRPRLALLLAFAGAMTKETAIPAVLALAVPAAVRAVAQARRDGASVLRRAWFPVAIALGSGLGVAASYAAYPKLPGWATGGSWTAALESLLVSAWVLPAAFVGVWEPRARPLLWALASTLAFYAAFVLLRGGAVNAWYAILPASLGLVAVAVGAQKGFAGAAPRRLAGVGASGLMVALLVAPVVGAGTQSLHPLQPRPESGLRRATAAAASEFAYVAAARAFQDQRDPAVVVEIDLEWFWIVYPFEGAHATHYVNTFLWNVTSPDATLVHEALHGADLVWLQDYNTTFDQAFRATYAPCQVFAQGPLVAYDVRACPATR